MFEITGTNDKKSEIKPIKYINEKIQFVITHEINNLNSITPK